MVSATQWRQDRESQPTNPNQRLRWYPAYPGQGGYATFGWSPVPVDGLAYRGSPAGFMDGSGLSGPRAVQLWGGRLGAPWLPSTSRIAAAAGAVAGVLAGWYLARANMGG